MKMYHFATSDNSQIFDDYDNVLKQKKKSFFSKIADKSPFEQGDKILLKYIKILRSFSDDNQFTSVQLDFLRETLAVDAKSFYRNCYNSKKEEILKRLGLEEIKENICFISARQMGKTFTTARKTLAEALAVCGEFENKNQYIIALFSTGYVASKLSISEIMRAFNELPEDIKSDYIYCPTQTKITFIHKTNGFKSIIIAKSADTSVRHFFFRFFFFLSFVVFFSFFPLWWFMV
jgi:hypothetical protein